MAVELESNNSNSNSKITTITIVHKTGRTRIKDEHENIKDIRFKDLVNQMNSSEAFDNTIKVVYCKFAKNQVNRLVSQTTYSISSNMIKEKENGLYEIILTKNKKNFQNTELLFN